MPEPIQTDVQPPEFLRGGKRTNLERSEWMGDWWVGYGKDDGCQFEGSWAAMVYLAAKILRHPATEVVAPNLYRPDLELTAEQEGNYTEQPHVEWPSDALSDHRASPDEPGER